VVVTRDYHPQNHCSLASNNHGANVFEKITLPNGVEQVMWPDHCVKGTEGCRFHPDLIVKPKDIKICKGEDFTVDSYSGFGTRPEDTGLEAKLQELNVRRVYVCGLAQDYCVGATALDAVEKGYDTYVISDLTKCVSEHTEEEMK
jgi:nicotinamidase/pyrazinamidase